MFGSVSGGGVFTCLPATSMLIVGKRENIVYTQPVFVFLTKDEEDAVDDDDKLPWKTIVQSGRAQSVNSSHL